MCEDIMFLTKITLYGKDWNTCLEIMGLASWRWFKQAVHPISGNINCDFSHDTNAKIYTFRVI
jgi:hypothetical protein